MARKSKSKTKKMSKVEILEAQMASIQHEIDTLERQNEAKKPERAHPVGTSKLIKKPSGVAGRGDGNGYNIQEAMGLAENKARYNRITKVVRDLAIQHLNMTGTITAQNPVNVLHVLALAKNEWPEVVNYEHAWPIREMLVRYLRSRRDYDKKLERNALKADEAISEAENIDPNDNQHIATKKRRKKKNKQIVVDSDSDIQDDEAPVFKRRRVITASQKDVIAAAVKKITAEIANEALSSEDTTVPAHEDVTAAAVRNIAAKIAARTPRSEDAANPIHSITATAVRNIAIAIAEKARNKDAAAVIAAEESGSESNDSNGHCPDAATKDLLTAAVHKIATVARNKGEGSVGADSDDDESDLRSLSSELDWESNFAARSPIPTRTVIRPGTLINHNKPACQLEKAVVKNRTIVTNTSAVNTSPAQDASESDLNHNLVVAGPKYKRKKAAPPGQPVQDPISPSIATLITPADAVIPDNAVVPQADNSITADNPQEQAEKMGVEMLRAKDQSTACRCPDEDCEDQIPSDLVDENLQLMLNAHRGIVRKKGADSLPAAKQVALICCYIAEVKNALEAREEAVRRGWPTEINFRALPDRILPMKDDLHRLIFVEGVKSQNLAQIQFKLDLEAEFPTGRGLEKFAGRNEVPGRIFEHTRPGYYGEKGRAVISSTVYRLFDPTTTKSTAFKPLKFTVYVEYVLAPYIGHLLIAEDLKCTLENAYSIMLESGSLGAKMCRLQDNDEELEDIIDQNQKMARKEKAKATAIAKGHGDEAERRFSATGRPLPRMIKPTKPKGT